MPWQRTAWRRDVCGALNGVSSCLYETLIRGMPFVRLLLGYKIFYFAILIGVLAWQGALDEDKFYAVNARWPREGEPTFASHFATWDSAHYLFLSEVGYKRHVPSCAFYPLWPLLVRWCAPLAAGSHLIAGLVLSNLFSLAAWVIFYQQVQRRWGASVADWALVFLIAFPGSLFFQFLYSESLFFLLVMLLWWGLEERHWGLAWVAALLLPLTRAVGVFAVLPIGWRVLWEARPICFVRLEAWCARQWGKLTRRDGTKEYDRGGAEAKGQNSGEKQALTKLRLRGTGCGFRIPGIECSSTPWGVLVLPLIGWGSYLTLMWHWTGSPFEGFVAQKHWGVHSVWNLFNVPKFIVGYFSPTEWHEFTGSLLDRCAFLMLLYTLPVLWRLDRDLLVWTYWLGILPAMSGTFTSYIRYVSCAFPVFIALGAFIGASQGRCTAQRLTRVLNRQSALPPWPKWALLAFFEVLHILLVWRFVNFRWAG